MSSPVPNKARAPRLTVREIAVFAMLGALMLATKKALEFLPNIHPLGMLVLAYTVVFRGKALYPIYIYVLLEGLLSGFGGWWVAYLYIWLPLWGITMLLPKKMPQAAAAVVYPILCALHGLAFGSLFAPVWAIMYRLTFSQMLLWIAQGFTFDLIHTVGNFGIGLLCLPLSELLRKLAKQIS